MYGKTAQIRRPSAESSAHIDNSAFRRLGDFFQASHLVRLGSFLSLDDVEFNVVALFQALIPVDLNRAIMHEHIRSVLTPDKSVPLGVVKPLHLALVLSHVRLPFLIADCGWGFTNLPTLETQGSALWFSAIRKAVFQVWGKLWLNFPFRFPQSVVKHYRDERFAIANLSRIDQPQNLRLRHQVDL